MTISNSGVAASDPKRQKPYVPGPSGPFDRLVDKLLEVSHSVFPHWGRVGRSQQPISVALGEPWRAFEHPDDVLVERGLSRAEKAQILERWAEDARALAIADDEGLGGGEPNRLADVMQAKGELASPTKREPS